MTLRAFATTVSRAALPIVLVLVLAGNVCALPGEGHRDAPSAATAGTSGGGHQDAHRLSCDGHDARLPQFLELSAASALASAPAPVALPPETARDRSDAVAVVLDRPPLWVLHASLRI